MNDYEGWRLRRCCHFEKDLADLFFFWVVYSFLPIMVLLCVPVAVWAGNAVTPMTLEIVPGNEQLEIRAPYSEDDNNDSQLAISWATTGTDWSDSAVESLVLDHQAGTFVYAIKNLQNFKDYQLRVEFLDFDGVNPPLEVQIIPALKPFNPLIHSSLSTGSSRWSSEGGWGIQNSKYGEFTCGTCHSPGTGNIKRIKKNLSVNDPLSTDQLPIQIDGQQVIFRDTRSGSSDFGDDQRAVNSRSTNICEACHTQTNFHNYTTDNNFAGNDHYNRNDCIGCHQHQQGFSASCGTCHANPPVWPSHGAHLASSAPMPAVDCSTCHQGADHLNTLSEVRFGSDWRVSGAVYSDQGQDETSRYARETGYADTPAYGHCDQLYCHSNGSPFDKSYLFRTPVWGGDAMGCASCHDEGGATSELSGRHPAHTNAATYAYDCGKCHADTASNGVIVNALNHINQNKEVSFASGGSFNDVSTPCASTLCHNNGAGSPPNVAVSWSDTEPLGCSGCHDGRIGDVNEMSSHAHLRLANQAWIRQYPCEYCHAQTTNVAGEIIDFTKHVNNEKNVAFDPKWKIVGKPDPSYNPATKVCDNLYCHSDGTSGTPQIRDFPWDRGQHAKCDSCHGHDPSDDCQACHAEGVPEVTAEQQWKMATPMYVNTGPGTARANSHRRHLETEFACENCHTNTVVGSCNTAGCHDGAIPAGQMSEVGHVFAEYHVNKLKDVIFKDGGSYDSATKTCSNTLCHAGADPQWGDSRNNEILCLSCHGTTEADVDDYGSFNGIQAKINMSEWQTSGHGRPTTAGPYTSGNAAANFPGNPCWYCHDNEILHKDVTNPYRLKKHPQFEKRFDKECVYCHMERKNEECWVCHDAPESLSINFQLTNLTGIDPDDGQPFSVDHAPFAGNNVSCMTAQCHLPQDAGQCRDCHDNPSDTSGALQLDDSVDRKGMANDRYKISEIRVAMATAPFAVDHVEFKSGGTYAAASCMATPAEWAPTGCHSADVHIHNTNSTPWTSAQKDDVKNQYVMMGVCLQCHDDNSNERCNTCHTWSGAPQDNPYKLGYDPGTGMNSGSSHASSAHFGTKHFEDYTASLENSIGSGSLSQAAKLDSKKQTTVFKDTTQSWTVDALVGKSVKITSGAATGEIRPILTNGAADMTISGLFSSVPDAGTTFTLLDTVWKGGKFCWDCHDPHGDNNIYMIQNKVSLKTDGLFGKPLERAAVSFTRTLSGLDYAKSSGDFNGICNVCHTKVEHYQADSGDNHRSGRRCTSCHNHGFAEEHSSGEACNQCHEQKPVPNHLGFGQSRSCVKCHDGVVAKRTDIMRQFNGQSHHVQGVDVTGKSCYQCHWEATSFGLIDNDYHAGYNNKTHESVADGRSDLVVRVAAERPERYELGTTAVTFDATQIGTAGERDEVKNVTQHCSGCHSDANNDVDIFGDCKTPRQYAWDNTSITARYSQSGATTIGKYIGVINAAQRNQQKSYSAHGNAVANAGGWTAATGGEDAAFLPNTRNGTENVQCYDCHSSHGSYTTGVTSSYRTFDNSYGGANLKETQAGKGGYQVTYKAGVTSNGVSTLNPGAAQCFDCHETANAGVKPWGYTSTFGASAPIHGYRDSASFDGLDNGVKDRFSYRDGKTGVSGHFSHQSTDLNAPAEEQVNGLCSGCHDPHGVSPTLGANQAYAVPLLKGTWLTSPYKEDRPQLNLGTGISVSNVQIDRKTFSDLTNRTHINENDDQFAGLCLRCHPKESLTVPYDPQTGTKPEWASKDRVHQAVKGWGSNNEHQFPCAKCHQPHSSGLPRLMRTNCLDWNHRGEVPSGGPLPSWESETQHYPRLNNQFSACHQSAGAVGGTETSGNFRNQQWNTVTPW